MKFLVLALLVAVASADRLYAPPARDDSDEIAILKDDRVIEDDGRYNFDMETANGIVFSESGSPVGDEGAVHSAGSFSYTAPDGSDIHLQYVADENGFQPQGDHLPVAPEFPHRSPTSSSGRSKRLPRRTPAVPVGKSPALTVLPMTTKCYTSTIFVCFL
nr:cuticle protein CP14.6-like [Penaeus vannamei]